MIIYFNIYHFIFQLVFNLILYLINDIEYYCYTYNNNTRFCINT